jgi:nicotinamide-nucleotide amidase
VDIRIAAKAKDEHEADAMIADVESQVRERLGTAVFGVDEDRLEEVTLSEVSKRGWTLTAVESGLDGLLTRKIPHTASYPDLDPASLMDALRTARTESQADIALGVAVYMEERAAEMALITSRGEKAHRITYGGPPRSLPRWSVNLALNWLRTYAMNKDENDA